MADQQAGANQRKRRHRVNGDGPVYKRKDGYWVARSTATPLLALASA